MPSAVKPPQTLYDKVFEDHIVEEKEDGTVLLYIGMSLCVEIVVWQALTGCRQASCSRGDITGKATIGTRTLRCNS
jgi:3-isopropylmalate dehydratase